jgi:hypothetical protein
MSFLVRNIAEVKRLEIDLAAQPLVVYPNSADNSMDFKNQ